MSVCAGVQNSGGVATACYIRNLSTERKAVEIIMEIFNFKCPLQAHDPFFEKYFKAETACRVTALVNEIFNLLIAGFYLLHICNSYRPNRLTDLLKFLY